MLWITCALTSVRCDCIRSEIESRVDPKAPKVAYERAKPAKDSAMAKYAPQKATGSKPKVRSWPAHNHQAVQLGIAGEWILRYHTDCLYGALLSYLPIARHTLASLALPANGRPFN